LGEDDFYEEEQQQKMLYSGSYHENGVAPPEQLDFPMPGN
jgi:hypothetical protein